MFCPLIAGWWFQIFFIFTPICPIWGRWTQFDEHIFQMGWFNHQLDKVFNSTTHISYISLQIIPINVHQGWWNFTPPVLPGKIPRKLPGDGAFFWCGLFQTWTRRWEDERVLPWKLWMLITKWWFQIFWKGSNLTNVLHMGWNQQLDYYLDAPVGI